jgi:hypothetical protein
MWMNKKRVCAKVLPKCRETSKAVFYLEWVLLGRLPREGKANAVESDL